MPILHNLGLNPRLRSSKCWTSSSLADLPGSGSRVHPGEEHHGRAQVFDHCQGVRPGLDLLQRRSGTVRAVQLEER